MLFTTVRNVTMDGGSYADKLILESDEEARGRLPRSGIFVSCAPTSQTSHCLRPMALIADPFLPWGHLARVPRGPKVARVV